MAQITKTSLFQPTSVPNCVMWFDAADPSSVIRTGTNVTQWNDRTGNGNTAVAGTATYPIYNTNTLNGKATIGMRNNNDYFLVSNNLTTTTYPSLCYFIVVRPATTQPNTSVAGVLSTDSAGAYGRSFAFGSGSFQEEYYSGFTNITAYTAEQWYFVSLQFTTTASATLAVNGTTYAGTASGTGTNTTGLKIGSYNDTSSYTSFNANFDVAEIMVYGADISTSQRQQLEGYLAWKWGLQSLLPATHPYKLYPPYAASPIPLNVPASSMTGSPVFLPTQISGCRVWLDAADTSTITLSGTTVTRWADKSGNNQTITPLGTPAGNVTLNSLPAINLTNGRFVGTLSSALTAFTSTTFIVTLLISYPGEGYSCVAYSPTSGTAPSPYTILRSLDYAATTFRSVQFDGTNAYVANVARTGLSTPFLWSSTFGSSALNVFLNGGSATNSVAGATMSANASYITIGCIDYNDGTNAWPGYVGEIITYNTVLTTAQRQQVEGYLAWKWGLVANLPASHPYKSPPIAAFPYGVVRSLAPASSWRPTNFSTCLLWLDAADTTTLTPASGTVTGWTNKGTVSVSANNTGSGAAGIVTSGSQRQNGKNLLVFPAGAGLSVTFASPNQARAWFIVARNTTQMSASVLYWAAMNQMQGAGQDSPFGPGAYASGGSTYTMGSGPSGLFNCIGTNLAPEPYNTMKLYTWHVSAVTTSLNTINVNGAPLTLVTNILAQSYRTDSVAYCINTPGYNTGSDICEIVFYNTELSVSQRQTVEGYLAWKWGLQASLPSNHLFKSYPPPP